MPVTQERLTKWNKIGNVDVDMSYIPNVLDSILATVFTDSMNSIKTTWTDANNGIDLWRYLFHRFQGGAECVQLHGLQNLLKFRPCPKPELVMTYVGSWVRLRDSYGKNLSEDALKITFLDMLPEQIEKDIRSMPHIQTVEQMIE